MANKQKMAQRDFCNSDNKPNMENTFAPKNAQTDLNKQLKKVSKIKINITSRLYFTVIFFKKI
jgi:hypothetical protein